MFATIRCFCIWLCLLPIFAYANTSENDTLTAFVIGNDTVAIRDLPELTVIPKPRTEFKNNRERRYYGRLVYDIKATLPYAEIAADLLTQVNDSLQLLETKREQNEFLKIKEKELFAEYEPIIRKMNVRRGRLLLKLIDRECQITSYEVVKIYRGGFSAFFWQGIARLFGNNLKSVYSPEDEDAMIEEIIMLVKMGIL